MAANQKKKTTAGNSGKKSTPAKPSSAKSAPAKRRSSSPNYQARTAWGVILLALAVFSALSWFQVTGIFIDFLERIERGFVGWGYWSVPLAMLLASGQLLFHRNRPVRGRTFCALMIPVLIGAGAHTVAGTIDLNLVQDGISNLWTMQGAGFTGGVLGGILAVTLSRIFSRAGTFFLLILLAVVITLILTQTSPEALLDKAVETHAQRKKNAKKREADKPKRLGARLKEADLFQPEAEEPFFDEPEEHLLPFLPTSARKKRIQDYNLEVDDPVMPLLPKIEPAVAQETDGRFQPEMPEGGGTEVVPARSIPPKWNPKEKLFNSKISVSTPDEYLAKLRGEEKGKKKEKKAVPDKKREEPVQAATEQNDYHYPSVKLLGKGAGAPGAAVGTEWKETQLLLSDTLQSFGIEPRIVEVTRGPAVTRYELELERGIKLSKITNLAGDIALSLGAVSVRIAPIPGKNSVVGIEVPNRLVTPVPIRSVIDSPEFREAKSSVSFAVGKDISNRNVIGDISKLPHLLIAGTTGSGKSVCTNSLIISLLYKSSPKEVRLIMIDPKMVELGVYNGIPHLLIPVVTDPKKAAGALQWAVFEMMRRYQLFANRGVRELESYNKVVTADKENPEEPMPQIVVVIDELADLMLVAAKEVEESICRVAQMGRAAGMHLIIATQRPSADVITGLMKANIPSRIAFAVASSIESRIILDTTGAEKLVGKGDMLFAPVGKGKRRVQGCLISDEEVSKVVEEIKRYSAPSYSDEVMHQVEENARKNEKNNKGGASAMNVAPPDGPNNQEPEDDRDPLYYDAVDVVVETGMASVSMLQRRLKLGYSRAARLVDQMEEYGVVGPFEGSKPRKVLVSKDRWNEMKLRKGEKSGLDPNLELAKVMSASADADLPPFELDD